MRGRRSSLVFRGAAMRVTPIIASRVARCQRVFDQSFGILQSL
jgi:hypothetical protein